MTFDIKALSVACAILWAGSVLVVGLINLACPSYGHQFLDMLASFYPGYHATHTIVQVAIVTLYAAADGLIGGAVFGWLYNRMARKDWFARVLK
jgi:membrane associated rhomboid family serine protease